MHTYDLYFSCKDKVRKKNAQDAIAETLTRRRLPHEGDMKHS